MNTQFVSAQVASHQPGKGPFPLASMVRAVLGVLVAVPLGLWAQVVQDNFNDGNANGWTEYDPLSEAPLPPPLGGRPYASFTVVDGAYRIVAFPSPAPANPPSGVGPGRAGAYRADVNLSTFYVAADILNFNRNLRQAFGLLARLGSPGLGQTTGYALTYDNTRNATTTELDISLISGEAPSNVTTTGDDRIYFEQGKSYRMVFIGSGSRLEGRVYELPNLETPLRTIVGNDSTYTTGFAGFVIYDNATAGQGEGADATFDNFLAAPVEPPRLEILRNQYGEISVRWPATATGFRLVRASLLPAGAGDWTNIPDPGEIYQSGGWNIYPVLDVVGNIFYRLVYP